MVPKLEEIRKLKYDVNYVDYDQKQKDYNLIQMANSLENQEFFLKGDDKVVKFVLGVRKHKKKTRKEVITNNNKKTKKIRMPKDFILEDDEEETFKDNIDLDKKFSEEENVKPVIDNTGNVRWNNDEYQKLWVKLPPKLRYLLKLDPDWLEDYMNECIKSQKLNNPCPLTLPKHIVIPPTKIDNGK